MTGQRVHSDQDYLILVAVSTEPLHGYAITQQVSALTGGALTLLPGTLYKALDRLLTGGWLEIASEEVVNSRLRRNYRLTGAGRAVLTAEVARRGQLEREVRRRMRGPAFGASA